MKKYILSFLVVGTFGLYILYLHITGNSEVAVISASQTNFPVDTSPSQPTISNTPPPDTPTPIPSSTPVPTPTKTPLSSPQPTQTPKQTGQYKDGTYTGISADAYYGNVQVEAVIQGGRLANIQILDYPQDRSTSRRINSQAMPELQSEAIRAQSANVNTISGATDSSGAFRQSLASALVQAKNS